jgi:hypothetical protein
VRTTGVQGGEQRVECPKPVLTPCATSRSTTLLARSPQRCDSDAPALAGTVAQTHSAAGGSFHSRCTSWKSCSRTPT